MMAESEKPAVKKLASYEACFDDQNPIDGIPNSIEQSIASARTNKDRAAMMSTSKFLLNDESEDDDRLSNMTDIIC